MKKKFFLIIPLVCFLLVLNKATAQRFRAGLSAGPVATDVAGADQLDSDNDFSKLGFTVGGIVNTELNKKNVLQMEINYIQKGHLDRPDSLNNGYYKLVLNYIEVPVLLKHRIHFTIGKKSTGRFDLEGGVSMGKLVNAKQYGSTNYKQDIDYSYINKTDVSIFTGIDYNFSSNFYFCLRYSNSVIPVIKRNSVPLFLWRYTFNQGNNMAFQFAFKIIFGNTANKEQEKDQLQVN